MNVSFRLAVLTTLLIGCATSPGSAPEDAAVLDAAQPDARPDAPSGAYFGEVCDQNSDCRSGICHRPSPEAPGHCTERCDGNCPDGYACKAVRLNDFGDVRICVPAEDTMCRRCTTHEECGDTRDNCIDNLTGGTFCSIDCSGHPDVCPAGFACARVSGRDELNVWQCVPNNGICCIDGDGDRHGVGDGCLGPDCDDGNAQRYEGNAEICDGLDNDCNDNIDDQPKDCDPPSCERDIGGYFERVGEQCDGVSCATALASSCGLYTCNGGGEAGDACAHKCDQEDDSKCVDSAHCDASACLADLVDGLACNNDSDCVSGHCQNGFCCATGDCCAISADCPGHGHDTPVCENPRACQGHRGEPACDTGHMCVAGGAQVPDDSGCAPTGPDKPADACGYYKPVFCAGGPEQESPKCAESCHSHADCDDDGWCDPSSDTCVADLADGVACGNDGERCRSGHCQNGFCCATGDCCATAADCPGDYSTPPVCTTPSVCDGDADVAVCVGAMCDTAQDVDDDSACGPSTVADDCGSYKSVFCTGASPQTEPQCLDLCSSDSDCDVNAYCSAHAGAPGQCVPDEADGRQCEDSAECQSGHCENGYCCQSGFCCAQDRDCNSFDEAPVCDSPATCQGSRVEGACSPSFQCGTTTAADDSGCGGIEANDCGPYPSVVCTSSPTQSPPKCSTSCGGDGQCDLSAHCDEAVCKPDQGPGGYCNKPTDCGGSLHCVDGVCCDKACNGACEACDLPDSVGTCTAVPSGSDPDNECGEISCVGFFHGWTGDSCLRRADVPANIAACNGARACRTQAQECGLQNQAGPVTLTCHGQCQDPKLSTCSGTVAGQCNNVNPGTQHCGVGQCQRSAPICQNGAPATCTPGSPVAESCNDLDDNCNGTIDDGPFSDIYEPNPDCSTEYQLGTVQSDQSNTYSSMTVYALGDFDYYKIPMQENDSDCSCGIRNPFDEDYLATVAISVPEGSGSFELCMNTTCGWSANNCKEIAAGTSGELQMFLDGACPGQDNYTIHVRVRGDNFPGFECRPYTLSYTFDAGYCR